MKYYRVKFQAGRDRYFKGARAAMISTAPRSFAIPATEEECEEFIAQDGVMGDVFAYEIPFLIWYNWNSGAIKSMNKYSNHAE